MERLALALEQRDNAYKERNLLVAFLTRLYPSHLAMHQDTPGAPAWDPEWRTVVCVHSPVGQLSWHIHVRELALFGGLSFTDNDWDGHSTPEKYLRLATLGETQ